MKKLILGLAAVLLSTFSMAVELNTATAADLDTIKGIGPKMSASILAERQKNGNFKDWADFSARVKGVGEKNSAKFSSSGLTVSGKALAGAPVAAGSAKPAPATAAAATKPSTGATPAATTAKATLSSSGSKAVIPASK